MWTISEAAIYYLGKIISQRSQVLGSLTKLAERGETHAEKIGEIFIQELATLQYANDANIIRVNIKVLFKCMKMYQLWKYLLYRNHWYTSRTWIFHISQKHALFSVYSFVLHNPDHLGSYFVIFLEVQNRNATLRSRCFLDRN